MIRRKTRNALRKRRHLRIRKKAVGTVNKPRLTLYKSHKYIYAQAVDDLAGRTIVAASSVEKQGRKAFTGHANKAAAKWVGERLGEQLAGLGVTHAVLDRSGYPYHGAVKELADAVRAKGVKF